MRSIAVSLRTIAAAASAVVAATLLVIAPADTASAATSCTARTGPYQKQVEAYLGLSVDGRNSSSDCVAIRAFQSRHQIRPAAGYAGPTTYSLIKRFRLAKQRYGMCVSRTKVVCVDLTSQTTWIAENRRITFGPRPIRSGRNGYETRTGVFKVYRKNIDHVSSIYGSPMPYAMFFSGGMAFHISDRYLYNEPGSHGCVHVNSKAIKVMWQRMPVGTTVHVFGRKPGT